MRYTHLVLLVSALLLTGSVTAVVGHNDTDGDVSITSGSSASASTSVSENGTEWTAKVEMTGTSSENVSDAVLSHEYAENDTRVDFSGTISAPTPCHVLDHEVKETGENEYVLDIKTVKDELDNDSMCAQVMTQISYSASFESEEAFTLEVQHDGEKMETIDYPQVHSDPAPGPISKFLNWIGGLF